MTGLQSRNWFVGHIRYNTSRRLTTIIDSTRGMGYWSGEHTNGVELSMKGL